MSDMRKFLEAVSEFKFAGGKDQKIGYAGQLHGDEKMPKAGSKKHPAYHKLVGGSEQQQENLLKDLEKTVKENKTELDLARKYQTFLKEYDVTTTNPDKQATNPDNQVTDPADQRKKEQMALATQKSLTQLKTVDPTLNPSISTQTLTKMDTPGTRLTGAEIGQSTKLTDLLGAALKNPQLAPQVTTLLRKAELADKQAKSQFNANV